MGYPYGHSNRPLKTDYGLLTMVLFRRKSSVMKWPRIRSMPRVAPCGGRKVSVGFEVASSHIWRWPVSTSIALSLDQKGVRCSNSTRDANCCSGWLNSEDATSDVCAIESNNEDGLLPGFKGGSS